MSRASEQRWLSARFPYTLQDDEVAALEQLAETSEFFSDLLAKWYEYKHLSAKQYECIIRAAKQAELIPED